MKDKNRLIFLVTFFIICLSYPVYGQVPFGRGSTDDLAKELAQTPQQGPNAMQDIIVKPSVIYKADNLRDPFKSYIESSVATRVLEPMVEQGPMPDLEVQGLFWGGGYPQAIINNKVLRESDTIEGVKIISIKKDGVTVLFANTEHKLSPSRITDSPQNAQKGGKQ